MKLFISICLLLAFGACQNPKHNQATQEGAIKPIKKLDGDYSEVIRIEDSILKDEADTSKMAKMTFDETSFNFGTVDEGDIVKHTFVYTNTGHKPLLLKVAHSTCGCTVPHYNTNSMLQPGEQDSIVVVFNTLNKKKNQVKPITVIANSYPNKVKLYLRGYVNPKQ